MRPLILGGVAGLATFFAMKHAKKSLRVQCALHVLQDKPLIYGWEFTQTDPITVTRSDSWMVKSSFTYRPAPVQHGVN
jgi:hypothetical protein